MSTVEPADLSTEQAQYMVEAYHTGDNNWYPISEETLSNGMSREIKPLTLEAAKKLHAWLAKNGGQAYARISHCKKRNRPKTMLKINFHTVVTHDTTFHADDDFAVAMITQFHARF